jgi:Rod binding domain-containing protein
MPTLDTTQAGLDPANFAYQAAAARATALADRGAGIPLGGSPAKTAAIKKAAQDFEAMFMSSMLESMTAGIKTDKTFGGGQGETMYRSLLNQEYGKAIASTGTLGLAASIEREMLRVQEQGQK